MFEFLKRKPVELEEPVGIAHSRGAWLSLDKDLKMECLCNFACVAAMEACEFNGTKVTTDNGQEVEFDGYDPRAYYGNDSEVRCIDYSQNKLEFPLSQVVTVNRHGENEMVTDVEQVQKKLFRATQQSPN